jgi:hypothetical protein
MVKLMHESSKSTSFSISYIDKNEAVFILGLLKNIPCTHCVDFFKGCTGGPTLQECAMMSDQDFINNHILGTEKFLCGKLRNIVALSKAEEQELSNNFEKDFDNRVSLLTQKHDDDTKYVLTHDKDELNSVLKNIEQQVINRLQRDFEKVNKHNVTIVNQMQEKLTYQNNMIKEMQDTIKKLKRNQAE